MYQVKIGLAWYDALLDGDVFRIMLRHSNRGMMGVILSGAAMARRLREGTAVVVAGGDAA